MSATDEQEIEVGWSVRSGPHAIVSYEGGKPRTACGKVLAGLMDNYWAPLSEQRSDLCGKCRSRLGSGSNRD